MIASMAKNAEFASFMIPNLHNNPRAKGDIPMYTSVVPIIGFFALKKRIQTTNSIAKNTTHMTIANESFSIHSPFHNVCFLPRRVKRRNEIIS